MKFEMDRAVTRDEALSLLKARWTPAPETEWVETAQTLGRVTAGEVRACHSLPVCRASAFDGIAVRSADFANGIPDTTKWVKGKDFAQADTGDDFPDQFDTVIAVEDLTYDGQGRLHLAEGFRLTPGDAVRPAGSMVARDELLLPARTRVNAQGLAALTMGGVTRVEVLKKLRVGFIPTGSELVPVGQSPARGQNVEANGAMLTALLERWGAEVVCHPIVRDERAELERALDEMLADCDLVVLNGGSSRGEEDYNAALLQARGEFFRHGVRAVPGRPIAISTVGGKPAINVPGPILAAFLAADWLLRGLVYHYYGLEPPVRPQVQAVLVQPVSKRAGFEMFLRLRLERTGEDWAAYHMGRGGSLAQALRADGLAVIPAQAEGWQAGEKITVTLLGEA